MKRLVIDLDGTLTLDSDAEYANATPNVPVIEQLRRYQLEGFEIVIQTARNMRTYKGNVGKINVHTLPVIIDWLKQHDVPFDEIVVGKPWCGFEGFYVDDRAVRPREFAQLSRDDIYQLIEQDARG